MGKAKKIASKVKQLATRTLQAEEAALKGLEEVKATIENKESVKLFL